MKNYGIFREALGGFQSWAKESGYKIGAGMGVGIAAAWLALSPMTADALYVKQKEFEQQAKPWGMSYFSEQMNKGAIPSHISNAYKVYLEEGETIVDVAKSVHRGLKKELHANISLEDVTKVLGDFDKAKKKELRQKAGAENYVWVPCKAQYLAGEDLHLQDQINKQGKAISEQGEEIGNQKKTFDAYRSEATKLMDEIQTRITVNSNYSNMNFEDIYRQLESLRGVLENMRGGYVTQEEFDDQIRSMCDYLDTLEKKGVMTENDLLSLRSEFENFRKGYEVRMRKVEEMLNNLYYPEEKFPLEFHDCLPGKDTSWTGDTFEITAYPLRNGEVPDESKYVAALLGDKKDGHPYKPDRQSAKIPDTSEGEAIRAKISKEWGRDSSFNDEPLKLKRVVADTKGLGMVTLGFLLLGPGKKVASLYGEGFKERGKNGKINYTVHARSPDSKIEAGGQGGPGGANGNGGGNGSQ